MSAVDAGRGLGPWRTLPWSVFVLGAARPGWTVSVGGVRFRWFGPGGSRALMGLATAAWPFCSRVLVLWSAVSGPQLRVVGWPGFQALGESGTLWMFRFHSTGMGASCVLVCL